MDLSITAFEEHVRVSRSKKTAQTYARCAKKLTQYLDAQELTLDAAPTDLLDGFVAWMVAEHMSESTVRLMTVGSRKYIEWRRRRGDSLPTFHKPDIPRFSPGTPRILDDMALARFVDHTLEEVPEPMRTVILVLVLTGMRSEEAVKLKLGDVGVQEDPDFETIAWVVLKVHGKGKKDRVIPLLLAGNSLIRNYLAGWRTNRGTRTDWLFPGVNGNHIQTRTIREHCKIVRDAIGIEECTPHTLRRTYLTLLSRQGVDALVVAQIAGHVRPDGRPELQTLSTHYVHHPVEDMMRALRGVRLPTEMT